MLDGQCVAIYNDLLDDQPDDLFTSVADLYRCRWQIEVFFKQIKQSLQLCDFLGNSVNAVRWQVWTALLLYVLDEQHSLR